MMLFLKAIAACILFVFALFIFDMVRFQVLYFLATRKPWSFYLRAFLQFTFAYRANLYYAAWTAVLLVLSKDLASDELMKYIYFAGASVGMFAIMNPHHKKR